MHNENVKNEEEKKQSWIKRHRKGLAIGASIALGASILLLRLIQDNIPQPISRISPDTPTLNSSNLQELFSKQPDEFSPSITRSPHYVREYVRRVPKGQRTSEAKVLEMAKRGISDENRTLTLVSEHIPA